MSLQAPNNNNDLTKIHMNNEQLLNSLEALNHHVVDFFGNFDKHLEKIFKKVREMTNLSILSSFDLGFRNKKNHYELNHYRV